MVETERLARGGDLTKTVDAQAGDGLVDVADDLAIASRVQEHQVLACVDT